MQSRTIGSESKQFRKLLADKANAIGTVAAYPSAYPIWDRALPKDFW